MRHEITINLSNSELDRAIATTFTLHFCESHNHHTEMLNTTHKNPNLPAASSSSKHATGLRDQNKKSIKEDE